MPGKPETSALMHRQHPNHPAMAHVTNMGKKKTILDKVIFQE